MDEIDRRIRRRSELDRFGDGLHLGFDGAAFGEVLDTGASGRVQLGGACGHDLVVLGMDRDDRSRLSGRSEQQAVVLAPLHEPRRDHEDLESSVAVPEEARYFRARGLARISHDDVECEVGERTFSVTHAALDSAPERTVLLVDHRHDGRHAARDGGPCAVLDVVERGERRRGREVCVQVDASGEHELAARVDLARGCTDMADRADALAIDREVRAALALWHHDGAAAYREVDHAVRRVKRRANPTARPASMTTWIQRSTPRRPRKTTIVSPKIVPARTIAYAICGDNQPTRATTRTRPSRASAILAGASAPGATSPPE